MNRQKTPLQVAKVLFTTKTNVYKKSKNMNGDTSEKQSVEMRSTFATSPVSAGAKLLAAARLVFGIFTNIAIIKDKVIKMFSLLRVNYLRSQSNDSAFTNLKE